jgi:hypothetical protein
MARCFIGKVVIPTGPLCVSIFITRNWFCKNGSIKKIDLANYEKTLIDTIAGVLDFEDSHIFALTMGKLQCDFGTEKTEITISPIDK